jgi:hypothetical protein
MTRTYTRRGGAVPLILNSALNGSGQAQALAVLLLAKEHLVTIELDVSGPQSRPGRFGKEQNLLRLPAPESLIIQHIA